MTPRSRTAATIDPVQDARLEVTAALVKRLIAQPDGRIVDAWRRPAFGQAVDAIRGQLAPIGDRAALRASHSREAGRTRRSSAHQWLGTGPAIALEIAYALRWMELQRGRPLRPFVSLVAAVPAGTLTTVRARQ